MRNETDWSIKPDHDPDVELGPIYENGPTVAIYFAHRRLWDDAPVCAEAYLVAPGVSWRIGRVFDLDKPPSARNFNVVRAINAQALLLLAIWVVEYPPEEDWR